MVNNFYNLVTTTWPRKYYYCYYYYDYDCNYYYYYYYYLYHYYYYASYTSGNVPCGRLAFPVQRPLNRIKRGNGGGQIAPPVPLRFPYDAS